MIVWAAGAIERAVWREDEEEDAIKAYKAVVR